MNQQTTAT